MSLTTYNGKTLDGMNAAEYARGYGGKYGSSNVNKFGIGNIGSSNMFDQSITGKNGVTTTQQGWGAPVANAALGVWSLYNQMQGQDAMQEDADRRFNFMENESKKNWAMKMNEWRNFEKRKNTESAQANKYRDNNGAYLTTAEREGINNSIIDDPFTTDANGNVNVRSQFETQTNPMQATNPITGGPSIRNQLSNINNIAGSAFAPQAPMNIGEKQATRATTTPTQRAGGSDVKKKMPGDRDKANEQDRVKKLTV